LYYILKNRAGEINFFLAIFLPLLLMAASVYAHYNELIELDLLSSYAALENPDQEGPAADKQNNAKVFFQISSIVICSSSFLPFQQFLLFCSPTPSIPSSAFVLRC
jgi:hypothetical protein